MGAAEKARVVPVDDFVREELYPGYKQAFGSQPFVAGPVRPFSLADNSRYRLRDSLHFSEGMVPASIAFLEATQVIKTGDRIRVDGRAGTVQVYS
jgi:hypothetical protein